MRPTSILTACALATMAAAAPAAHAATVSPAGVRFPQIAVNAGGATVVAWERETASAFEVQARSGDTPLELGRAQRLAARGYSPRVAVGADGTRAVMWLERALRGGVRSVRVAVARPRHRFGRGQLLDSRRANMGVVDVAVQPNGRVVAVWGRSSSVLGYAIAKRNHAFGKARNLTRTAQSFASTLALDPRDGAVVLAYGTPPSTAPPANRQAGVRTLATTAATFSAPTVVSDPAGLGESAPIVVGGSGATGVAYNQSTSTRSLRIARRKADGTWAASELIASPTLAPDVFAEGLRATLPADGSAVASWSIATEYPGGLGGLLSSQTVACVAPAAGAFGAPVALSPPTDTFIATAVASAGAEAFVATAKAHGPVLLASKPAGAATLGAPVTLAPDGDGDILLAAGGAHVLAAWQRGDRLHVHIVR